MISGIIDTPREAEAKAEVGVTAISRRAAGCFIAIFLGTIIAVPVIDQVAGGYKAWRNLAGGGDMRRSLRNVESALEEQGVVAKAVRPVAQRVLTKGLGVGNEHVYCARGGWLFYEPDVRHVTMRGFLEAATDDSERLRRRQIQTPRNRDPVRAILDFQGQLEKRGVKLVIVPTPVKPMVHPEMLWPRAAGPMVNASFESFKGELEAHGVVVLDATGDLAAAARAGSRQFLATDTHWRPEAMEAAAARVAELITERVELPQSLGVEYSLRGQIVRGRGDLAAMLQILRPPTSEEVIVQQVLEPDGQPWGPRADAEILWLGDSFSNIYSSEAMGWGSAGGFAEHVSRRLGRPLDAMRRNDDGAFATRQMLADELAVGNDRLAGKKLVIWQFAARELSFGDWKPIELRLATRPVRRFIVPPPGQVWTISATVASKGISPRPANVAYRDHVLAVHLTDVTLPSSPAHGDAVVYLRSMIDGKLTAAAELQIGQKVRLTIRDWSEVSRQFEFIRRSDVPEAELRSQPPCWGELLR
jgi:alginate O-acetyltransferase complex protein AlgJ